MIKSLIVSVAIFFGITASAATDLPLQTLQQTLVQPIVIDQGLDFKVGDTADYSLSGGIISGSMHVLVREATAEGFWIEQNMDLGFLGKQKAEILYDKNTGAILQLIVNGQKQTPPNPGDVEVVEAKPDRVTVPKGTFDCLYVKLRDKKNNSDSEAWMNMDLVPIGGLIKAVQPSQIGTITIVLTNFRKQAP
ncbi:MAG: hypothetical protein A2Z20_11400 [Bdellovibrionales bacterium RBG_16_40_8]|nr:MAG: hypothetical protein A2Z20_11400 [Bdellovibrionales bacterium RBG_16_40_8]